MQASVREGMPVSVILPKQSEHLPVVTATVNINKYSTIVFLISKHE